MTTTNHKLLAWKRSAHIPVIIILQLIFIILFAKFVVYNPENAVHNVYNANTDPLVVYPMFQDVHVMIFIGFGFLMTFLKKYGLSAVSVNMLIAVISLEWAVLVNGFFHLHKTHEIVDKDGNEHVVHYPGSGVIYLDVSHSMLNSDFAAATILISFGVLLGKTSPLQLIVMTLIEIVLFVVNEVIGRNWIGALDAGDTIFVHMFGAYFGLAVSRILYDKRYIDNDYQSSNQNSDLFSMVGTIFLWLFWPSFNAAAAVQGAPQHRAVLNTYFSLCASVMASFAFSAFTNPHKKFVMEHIQNATLAGGVAIGASADMMVEPYGALIIGTIAGIVSTCGFKYVTPFLAKRSKIHDTCGVNNLHGMPSLLGGLVSIILAAAASPLLYTEEGMKEVFPDIGTDGVTTKTQALRQFIAIIITLGIAITGGIITGVILKAITKFQDPPGSTVVQLALNISAAALNISGLRKEDYFNDELFFEVHDDGQKATIIDSNGKKHVIVIPEK